MNQLIKRIVLIIAVFIVIIASIGFINKSNASNDEVISNKTESTLVKMKERELHSLDDYKKAYGSDSYGLTAYILHRVQIISIPFTILGVLIAAVYDYIIGVRHLETKEKGQALMIMFITLGIICQVLPLVFTIAVKFGRE